MIERVLFGRGELLLSKLTRRNYLQPYSSSSSDAEYAKVKTLKGYTIKPDASEITKSLVSLIVEPELS
jgi:hypothetical protein